MAARRELSFAGGRGAASPAGGSRGAVTLPEDAGPACRLGDGKPLLAGGAFQRWSVFKAGFASAEDPQQTVGPQRERVEQRKGATAPPV